MVNYNSYFAMEEASLLHHLEDSFKERFLTEGVSGGALRSSIQSSLGLPGSSLHALPRALSAASEQQASRTCLAASRGPAQQPGLSQATRNHCEPPAGLMQANLYH
ncbi:hypothetical protein E2C01_075052 [Portunus trituberculatus]|uniref:Uncharacterized protein n=1 Tax=Portunus trituberculatus TaxID=210409 RepID=A0A5B7I9Q0_PORTR|nr:hypothetical protein [Portunus trituberculatus]